MTRIIRVLAAALLVGGFWLDACSATLFAGEPKPEEKGDAKADAVVSADPPDRNGIKRLLALRSANINTGFPLYQTRINANAPRDSQTTIHMQCCIVGGRLVYIVYSRQSPMAMSQAGGGSVPPRRRGEPYGSTYSTLIGFGRQVQRLDVILHGSGQFVMNKRTMLLGKGSVFLWDATGKSRPPVTQVDQQFSREAIEKIREVAKIPREEPVFPGPMDDDEGWGMSKLDKLLLAEARRIAAANPMVKEFVEGKAAGRKP